MPTSQTGFPDQTSTGGGGGSTTIAVQDDETVIVAAGDTLNFKGDGVIVTDVAGVPTITVSGVAPVVTTIDALYWRITEMDVLATSGRAFVEIEFRETVGGAPTVPSAVSAFSTFQTLVPANAVDGNLATLWGSDGKNVGEFFQAQFASAINLAQIEITARNDSNASQAPRRFKLEYSDDGSTWTIAGTTVETISNYTAGEARAFNLTSLTTTVTSGGGSTATSSFGLFKANSPLASDFPTDRSLGGGTATITDEDGSLRIVSSSGTGRAIRTKDVPVGWKVLEFGIKSTIASGNFADIGAVLMAAGGQFVSFGVGTGSTGSNDHEARILRWNADGSFNSQLSTVDYTSDTIFYRLSRQLDAGVTDLVRVYQSTDGWSWTYVLTVNTSSDMGGDAAYVGFEVSDQPDQLDVIYYADADILPPSGAGGGGSSGISKFSGLSDTPANYTGQGGKIVGVKTDETGLEYVAGGGGGGLADAPSDGDSYLRKDATWVTLATQGAEMQTALNALLGNSDWTLAPPKAAVSSRYWSVRDLGVGDISATEIEFRDPQGVKIAGTYSASGERIGSSAGGANDGNPATYWRTNPNAWFAVDFGVGNENTVASIAWEPFSRPGPDSGFGLFVSDDGIAWNLVSLITHTITWVDGIEEIMSFPEITLGSYDGLAVQAALDNYIGGTDWRTGGAGVDYINVDVSLLSGADDGKTLIYQNSTKTFIIDDSATEPMLLGGGQTLIVEHALTGNTGITIDNATYDLNQYDEIHLVYRDASSRMDIEISTDGGTTTQNIVKSRRADTDSTGAHTQSEFGPDTDNETGSMGQAIVTNMIAGVPTTVFATGAAVGGGNQLTINSIANDTSLTNAIILNQSGDINFTSGTLWVVGIKKSKQPLEFSGRLSAAWAANTEVSVTPTMGCKFIAGTVGVATIDQDAGQAILVQLRNAAGTVIAAGTIASGATTANIVAAATATITDEVVLHAVGDDGTATSLNMAVRGELA